jgi:hypothetical protein
MATSGFQTDSNGFQEKSEIEGEASDALDLETGGLINRSANQSLSIQANNTIIIKNMIEKLYNMVVLKTIIMLCIMIMFLIFLIMWSIKNF